MSAVPQGAFASVKVKQILENQTESRKGKDKGRSQFRKIFFPNETVLEQPPLSYSGKLMNSIWGLYNQYSVHNFKKNFAGDVIVSQYQSVDVKVNQNVHVLFQ